MLRYYYNKMNEKSEKKTHQYYVERSFLHKVSNVNGKFHTVRFLKGNRSVADFRIMTLRKNIAEKLFPNAKFRTSYLPMDLVTFWARLLLLDMRF